MNVYISWFHREKKEQEERMYIHSSIYVWNGSKKSRNCPHGCCFIIGAPATTAHSDDDDDYNAIGEKKDFSTATAATTTTPLYFVWLCRAALKA